MMSGLAFPRMFALRQAFPAAAPLDIAAHLNVLFAQSGLLSRIKPGARIAVGAGSRGISNLSSIVGAVIGILKRAGAQPFIVPAMGSHGGATAEGQAQILADYGISEMTMGVPVRASMEVKLLGTSSDGVPVYFSVEALNADGVIAINRVKPHTDFFSGTLGSGVLKMFAIGLAKRTGAGACHAAAAHIGYERVLRGNSAFVLGQAPVLGGVAILENQLHETAKLAVIPREELVAREGELMLEARRLMPTLPFDDIDLLIIDQIGKNISGSGMDPNIIGRSINGYVSSLEEAAATPLDKNAPRPPQIRRIFVRELTPETHGNGVGIGMADFTTSRLVNAIDKRAMFINSLTALSLQASKLPMHFETDREILGHALDSLALADPLKARVVRVRDTLSLGACEASEACLPLLSGRAELSQAGGLREVEFDAAGNLTGLLGLNGIH